MALLISAGLMLLCGFCGQISLGHLAFFAVGAFTTAVGMLEPVVAWLMPQFHRPRPLAAETEADGIGHADR